MGDLTLHEYRLQLSARSWSFLHTGAILTSEQEQRYLGDEGERLPYGVMLWPASIALAHDLSARGDELVGKRVLELGAGTGMPGIVAAALGAQVLQIDHSQAALHVCAMNAQRNGVTSTEVRDAEWETFHSEQRFDLVLGSDVLYVTTMHDRLRAICDQYLAPGGKALFADPFRAQSLPMLEAMEASGWRVALAKWSIQVEARGSAREQESESGTRTIGVYEVVRR
jgi:predicted nicotinamide N-methyase